MLSIFDAPAALFLECSTDSFYSISVSHFDVLWFMPRGFRFTVEKGANHLSIHLCIKRSQYVKLVYKMIIHNKEPWKHHHQQEKMPMHKSVTCKITSVHKYLLWMSSCVSTYSKWMSRQICIQIKLQDAIVAAFALLTGTESQLEVYYELSHPLSFCNPMLLIKMWQL